MDQLKVMLIIEFIYQLAQAIILDFHKKEPIDIGEDVIWAELAKVS